MPDRLFEGEEPVLHLIEQWRPDQRERFEREIARLEEENRAALERLEA